jgi:putative DNA primase/helicase
MPQLKYDKSIIIATGINRDSKKWKNRKLMWSDLVAKLSEAHRTHETVKEYQSYPKSRRDEIKDVGGFVGGNIAGGRRKKGAVTCRTLITLDSDNSELTLKQTWQLFKMLYGCAALIYTTHSHTSEDPRYRLVVPLDREVTPEEHEPIARKIAGSLDIEYFDNTTFQAERLMYWPSTSKDGEFVVWHYDGPILCADDILASYIDWKDSSQWPVSAKAIEAVKRGAKKQGDPLEKPGLVGAFCRAYGIDEAIEKYLGDTYEKTDMEDRYTYIGGSTSAGLVVYENKFAYSHHGTDPVSEKLCNAFDLVRIHLYGDQDAELEPGVPVNKRPSYKQMKLLCSQDKTVKKLVASERIENARQDFGDIELDEEPEDGNDEWLTNLEVDGEGNNKQTIDNLLLILENDPKLKNRVAIDVFKNNRVKVKKFPWTKDQSYLFKDADESHIRHHIEKCYGIFAPKKISDALEIVSEKNVFHPVRDYLNGLPKWDGVARLETLLIDYYGAEDSQYTREVTRKALVAAVNRVMVPGVKFDYMLLLIGQQGVKKSTFFSILAGQWFNESFSFHMIGKKDSVEQLQGSWIIEVQELDGMRRSDVDSVKSFVSIRKDEMRPAYGRHKMEYKRQGIFVGTSNEDTPLLDQTGGRRFWPVKVSVKPTLEQEMELTDLRNQIWAEALAIYNEGELLYLDDATEEMAKKVQADHTEIDVRADAVLEYLEKLLPDNWETIDVWQKREYLQGETLLAKGQGKRRKQVTIMEIWIELFGGSVKDMNKNVARDLNNIMRQMKGWEQCRFGANGDRQRGYRRRVQFSKNHVDVAFQ